MYIYIYSIQTYIHHLQVLIVSVTGPGLHLLHTLTLSTPRPAKGGGGGGAIRELPGFRV